MLMNSLSLDESSEPLIWVSVEVGVGVDRFGVDGREGGFEPCGVVVVEGSPEDGAAEAMLTVFVVAVYATVCFLAAKVRILLCGCPT